MSQPPYQQPPWGAQQQPAWGTPPPPPRPPAPPKKNKAGKILGLGCAGIAGFFIVALTIGAIVSEGKPEAKPTPSASSSPKARETSSLPARPDLATSTAYIADLDAIDPDIVHGKDDKAISRGRSQCSSIKTTKDRKRLIELTNYRFTSPTHPNGHGTKIAEQILDVVHERLCPDF